MSAQTELVIFRVAQEALTNVSRHAAASTVDVCLLNEGSTVTLVVVDDGQGFEPTVNGEGIRGMRERALAVGGELRIRPAAAGGTEVWLRVPLVARTR
jgi:two-component system sensor histidine kinase UhpB